MAIKIGHASIDENGKVSGGKTGDQTGSEVCTRNWYSKPWNVMLVCTDKTLAKKAAENMEDACANNNIGYNQSDRQGAYNSAVKNSNNLAKAKGDTDCSALVSACYKLAGLNINQACTTSNLKAALLATGKFTAYTDSAHLTSDAYAEVGAIYLKEGSHVVMALEDGSKAKTASTTSTSTNAVKVDAAKSYDKSIATTYKTTTALNLRAGAGTDKTVIATMAKGAKAICYGYYTTVSGTKWYLVVSDGNTGFCSSKYLTK